MTLPFADKPELSRVYADLKTKKLSEITSTELDALKSSIFAEGVSGAEDEYRRLLLLQLLTTGIATTGGGGGGTQDVDIVAGAPLAQMSVAEYPISSSGNSDIYTPASGQVWQIVGASLRQLPSGGYCNLYIRDTSGGTHDRVKIGVDSSSDPAAGDIFALNEPIFITSGHALQVNTGSSGFSVQLGLIRIR